MPSLIFCRIFNDKQRVQKQYLAYTQITGAFKKSTLRGACGEHENDYLIRDNLFYIILKCIRQIFA